MLAWAMTAGCVWNTWVCFHAVEGGHFDVLRWAVEHGCPHPGSVFSRALATCDTEMIDWMLDNNCEMPEDVLADVVRRGDTDVLECYLKKREYDPVISTRAASKGHVCTLKWLRKRGYCISLDAYEAALDAEQEDAARWLYRHGYVPLEWDTVHPYT